VCAIYSNSFSVSSIIVQTFNTAPTPSVVTAQTRYCEINIARRSTGQYSTPITNPDTYCYACVVVSVPAHDNNGNSKVDASRLVLLNSVAQSNRSQTVSLRERRRKCVILPVSGDADNWCFYIISRIIMVGA
jgi:hypothetical protein